MHRTRGLLVRVMHARILCRGVSPSKAFTLTDQVASYRILIAQAIDLVEETILSAHHGLVLPVLVRRGPLRLERACIRIVALLMAAEAYNLLIG